MTVYLCCSIMTIKYPCVFCAISCRSNQKSIFCDICEHWAHFKCTNLALNEFMSLGNSSSPYFKCYNCLFQIQTVENIDFVNRASSYLNSYDNSNDTLAAMLEVMISQNIYQLQNLKLNTPSQPVSF